MNIANDNTSKAAPCPICRKAPTETYKPFCSKRCADVDLARWLGGTYAIPAAPSEPAEGRVTAIAKYMATAASTALPPFARISRPTSAALLSSAATAANAPPLVTGERPALPAVRPAGLEALEACSTATSVSLLPQADSKRTPASAKLRN